MDATTRIDELPVKLAGAGIVTLADLARHSEAEVLALHGMDPASFPILSQALAEAGLAFAGTCAVPDNM